MRRYVMYDLLFDGVIGRVIPAGSRALYLIAGHILLVWREPESLIAPGGKWLPFLGFIPPYLRR